MIQWASLVFGWVCHVPVPQLTKRTQRTSTYRLGKPPHEHNQQKSMLELQAYRMHIKMPKHTQIPESSIIQQKQHTYISSINMFIIINQLTSIYNCRDEIQTAGLSFGEELTRNKLRRCNVPPNHRPACSSVSQQRCHPRAGNDSSRTKGQLQAYTQPRGHKTIGKHRWFYQAV